MQSAGLLSFVLLGSFLFLTYSCQGDASPISSNELLSSNDDEPKISVGAFLRLMENLQDELEARREIMAVGDIMKRAPMANHQRGSVHNELVRLQQILGQLPFYPGKLKV